VRIALGSGRVPDQASFPFRDTYKSALGEACVSMVTAIPHIVRMPNQNSRE